MKKIIFLSLPMHGHINPTLPIVAELIKRGYYVIYYATDEFREKVEATGAEYRAYVDYEDFDKRLGRNGILLFQKLLEATRDKLPSLLKEIEKEISGYSVIVHDAQFLPGKIIAEKLGIPAVSLSTTFVLEPTIRRTYPRLYVSLVKKTLGQPQRVFQFLRLYLHIQRKYHLRHSSISDLLINKESLNIVFTSSYFQPGASYLDNTYRFVGPSFTSRGESERFLKSLPEKKKIIYIALGTIYNDDLDFYKLCMETLAATPYYVVISLGHRFHVSDLPSIPENVLINNYIPQLEILQKTSLFISHGGMNSINESLYYSVPMLIVPQMDEQRLNALRVQELGAGVYIERKKLTQNVLLQTVERILGTQTFYTNARKIQKTLREAGGYKKAAEEIIEYVKQHSI